MKAKLIIQGETERLLIYHPEKIDAIKMWDDDEGNGISVCMGDCVATIQNVDTSSKKTLQQEIEDILNSE